MPEEEGRIASETIFFMNDTFDSVNGPSKNGKGELQCVITRKSAHHQFWQTAKSRLHRMRFVDKVRMKPANRVLSVRNWKHTINSFQRIWERVDQMGFSSLNPRNLNQDCVENFFGQMRLLGGRNVRPNVWL